MNHNRTKGKSYSENSNISNEINISLRVDNEIPWIDELFLINPNQTKSKNSSNYCNMRNIVDEEISFIEEIQSNHSNLNHFKNKYYNDNTLNSNYNIKNRLDNKKVLAERC